MGVLHALPVVLPATPIRIAAVAVALPRGIFQAQPGIRNTESVGVLVDKIVFYGADIQTGALIVEIKWNNENVTDGFVPLAAVTWPQNRAVEGAERAIRLTKPLYLAPGDYLSISVDTSLAAGLAGAGPFRVSALAIGRQCAAPPAERWLPFLSAYLGPPYTANSGAAISDQSTPADLGNPYDTDLFVERMIGRVLSNANALPTLFFDQEPAQVWDTFLMRVSDHRDNFWVANPTPLPLVCNAVDRSWILNHTMEPKGFLRVEFEGIANVADPLGTAARATVGLVGYRRIG